MERRTYLGVMAGGLLAAPLAAEAQQAGKVYRIGMLERTSPGTNAANLEAFRRGLRELGYVEGKNLVIEYRSADGRDERYAALATELIRALVIYGVNYPDHYLRAATFVDRIFKGTLPGNLPVERPTKFELVINLKTAKALGLTIPPSLLQRADQVIE